MHVYTFKACSIKMNNDAKNIVHYSKFSLIILKHAIFDDSVTVIEWNLTKAGRLVGLAGCDCGCGYSTSRHCNNFIGCKPHSRTSVTFRNYMPCK